jgi:paraquat-inducible protein B
MRVEADLMHDNVQLIGPGADDPRALLLYMVNNGLRAQLNMQSVLTGLLYVQLDFHPEAPLQTADLDSPYPQIPTIPTELEQLRQTLQSIDYSGVARDLADIASSLRTVLRSEAFAQLPEQLQSLLATVDRAGRELSSSLNTVSPRLETVLGQGEQTLKTLQVELEDLAGEGRRSMQSLRQTLSQAQGALQAADLQLGSDSPTLYQLNRTLEELARASRALHSLAQTLEEQPDALLRGRRENTP